jgi:hypothetical protein
MADLDCRRFAKTTVKPSSPGDDSCPRGSRWLLISEPRHSLVVVELNEDTQDGEAQGKRRCR